MRKVLFLLKSYVDGAIREAGSEHWISLDTLLHAHMIDVDTGEAGAHPGPATHEPWFIDHSGDAIVDSLHSTGYNPSLAERAKG
jgi:hypothetical protein